MTFGDFQTQSPSMSSVLDRYSDTSELVKLSQLLDFTSLLKRSWEQFLYAAAACRSHFLHRGFRFVYVAAAAV